LNPFPSANGGINNQEYLDFLKDFSIVQKTKFYKQELEESIEEESSEDTI